MTHWGRKPRKPRTLVVVLLWGSMRQMMMRTNWPNCWEVYLSLLFQSCEAVHRHGFYEGWKPKDAAKWVEATDGRKIEKQTGDDKITRWVIIPSTWVWICSWLLQ
jgi:hypothetical protein